MSEPYFYLEEKTIYFLGLLDKLIDANFLQMLTDNVQISVKYYKEIMFNNKE